MKGGGIYAHFFEGYNYDTRTFVIPCWVLGDMSVVNTRLRLHQVLPCDVCTWITMKTIKKRN